MKKKFQFLIVVWVVLLSGAVAFLYNYNIVFYLFVGLIIIYLRFTKISLVKLRAVAWPILVFSILIILTLFVNADFSATKSYAHLMLKIILASIIPLVIPFENFKEIYLKFVFFLSITSLLIYFIVLLYPGVLLLFPKISNGGAASYFNLGLAVYKIPLNNLLRNGSIFWEAGAFQVFINLAIALELRFYQLKHKKRLLVFILTIISTFSTTAFVILTIQFLFFLLYNKQSSKKGTRLMPKIIIFSSIIMFLFSSLFIDRVIGKFSDTNTSFLIRSVSLLTDIEIFNKAPILGVGVSNYKILVKEIAFNNFNLDLASSMNSITYSLAHYGIIFLSVLFFYYLKSSNILSNKNLILKWGYFAVFLMLFSTSNFLLSFLFLTFLFYGIVEKIEHKDASNSRIND